MPIPETVTAIAAKVFWPFLGAVLALIVIPPKTRTEATKRGSVSVVSGFVGGPALHEWMGISDTVQNAGFSLAMAAFCAWWVLGAVPRFIGRISPKTDD